MKKKNLSAWFIGRFNSIQSVIFATVAVLILSAVVVVTGVSMRFTYTSIFENSSEKMVDRIYFLQFMLQAIGLDIFDESLIQEILSQSN